MIKNLVAKVFNPETEKIVKVSIDDVTLRALCAYRDELVMQDNYDSAEVNSELELVSKAIFDIVDKIHIKS